MADVLKAASDAGLPMWVLAVIAVLAVLGAGIPAIIKALKKPPAEPAPQEGPRNRRVDASTGRIAHVERGGTAAIVESGSSASVGNVISYSVVNNGSINDSNINAGMPSPPQSDE